MNQPRCDSRAEASYQLGVTCRPWVEVTLMVAPVVVGVVLRRQPRGATQSRAARQTQEHRLQVRLPSQTRHRIRPDHSPSPKETVAMRTRSLPVAHRVMTNSNGRGQLQRIKNPNRSRKRSSSSTSTASTTISSCK